MKTYRIVVAYDGTDYLGWQIQPKGITVTFTLQQTFQKVFGKTIHLLGASRTDAGVHALGQNARFMVDGLNDIQKMMYAWNNALPPSIVIRSLEEVSSDYNPRYKVESKTYYYHLFYKRPLPFVARYGWFYKHVNTVDWETFNNGMSLYEGTHDFASFCKVEREDEQTVRKIDSIKVVQIPQYRALRVEVKGKGFLRFQIRRMIGYALDVARRNDLDLNYLKNILNNPDKRQTLLKADAAGLVLRKIVYR